MDENILALYESGMIPFTDEKAALDFCKKSKVGEHKCCVVTRYGWCCDLCLEDELLNLYSRGIHTINSCCGHGDFKLASILTVGEESKQKMEKLGYVLADDVDRRTDCGKPINSWYPQSTFIYNALP